jgi:type VI secretion system protein
MRPHFRFLFRRTLLLCSVMMALTISGCGSIFQHATTAQVEFHVDPTANENSAVEVDVVAVYNKTLLDTLLALPARQWFPQKAQFALDYPDGYKAWNWQLVPGQNVPPREISAETDKAYGVLVFANYRTDGDHRARIGTLSRVVITLQQKGFTVSAIE